MVEPSPGTTPTIKMAEDRLDSWKEIAAYLDRDVTTVQRWEKRERMPVHRHQHDRMGSVYAFPSELDLWQKKRIQGLEGERGTAVDVDPGSQLSGIRTRRRWLWFGVFMAAGIAAITYFVMRRHAQTAAIPKITSLAVLPLKNLSGNPGQEYLADGMTEALIG